MSNQISIKGAKMHNLKNIDIDIPKNKLVAITGVSGSGKSSLAFDTIYAEGQRRYMESLSSYARQFLQTSGKPEVDSIEGLSPAISIDQKTVSRNPRSTVGTITEIYDYLRLLYAKVGDVFCPKCQKKLSKHTVSQMIEDVANYEEGTKIMVMAPIVRGEKGSHIKTIARIESEGFLRYRVDGELHTIADEVELDPEIPHDIEIVVDRIIVKDMGEKFMEVGGEKFSEINPNRSRLSDSIELALKHGNGLLYILNATTNEVQKFSERFFCEEHNEVEFPEIEPRSFSFNSPVGACERCHGLGSVLKPDLEKIFSDDLTISEGGILPWSSLDIERNQNYKVLEKVAKKYKFDFKTEIKKFTKEQKEVILYGTGDKKYSIELETEGFKGKISVEFDGLVKYLDKKHGGSTSEIARDSVEKFMSSVVCPDCDGNRLKKEVLSVLIDGKNIIEATKLNIFESKEFFEGILKKLDGFKKEIAEKIAEDIVHRLEFLLKVGVGYLNLDRSAPTLSGGEGQRIRLATQIGSALEGVLYVLDEPSIGLHQRDNSKLIETMRGLQEIGNSVIVVEHDEDTMKASDYIIEIGPKAGVHGGELIAQGTYEEILKNEKSETAKWLSGEKKIEIPKKRKGNGDFLEVIGANENNLQNVDVKIPLGCLVGITGVSGSGKSSLINGILSPFLTNKLNKGKRKVGKVKEIKGYENLDKIIRIDQTPIGRTPKSNPVTYTGTFQQIREVFAGQPESKVRGYGPGRFSFNVKGGRCEACQGDGMKKIEMHFMPDMYVKCEECQGKRYNRETLEITYRGKNIYEVLEMTVSEALEFFKALPKVKAIVETLENVGLGYIKLGQPSPQLSGGEAQRVKLATELAKIQTGNTIYLLDEPTTGLYFSDIAKLIDVIQGLVDKGNSVLIIEHNLDMIKICDHIIDIGLDGGDKGGRIVAQGSVEDIAKCEESFTGQYLKKLI
ncbi:excinuclease ABC subunit UvrA [Candidatus Gracilibacteria bacterium]|nr:excinuclease ABC subunit UvrA [Candidatus Gracilibacteria bacterium]